MSARRTGCRTQLLRHSQSDKGLNIKDIHASQSVQSLRWLFVPPWLSPRL